MEIWVNPDCSKCCAALTILDDAGADYTVRHYLDDPPTVAELAAVLARLGMEPWDIARAGEPEAVELGIDTWPREPAERTRWMEALAEHPVLIQRPIITADDRRTVIGRSSEAVRGLLEG